MTREDALNQLRIHAGVLREMGAIALYFYGSTARDEAGAKSDLGLFLEYDPDSQFNAFDLTGIKLFLEEQIGSTIDLATRGRLHPRLRKSIENFALRVF